VDIHRKTKKSVSKTEEKGKRIQSLRELRQKETLVSLVRKKRQTRLEDFLPNQRRD